MKNKTAWLALTLCIFTQASAGEILRVGAMADRVADFKKTAQFQEKLVQREKHEQVCFDWGTLALPDLLAGWKEVRRVKDSSGDMIYYRLVFNREKDDYMTIDVTVMSPENNLASKEFLEVANATTMSEMSYMAGPDDLGTVSAISKTKQNRSVIWFFRNLFFKISNEANTFDALPLAHWLQKQAEMHIFPIKNEK